MNWDFRVRGFAGSKHPGKAPFGVMLVETSHRGISSAQTETLAWAARIDRGEVSRVEIIDMRPGGKMTNLKLYTSAEIKALEWK
jgi:hypothetical protein